MRFTYTDPSRVGEQIMPRTFMSTDEQDLYMRTQMLVDAEDGSDDRSVVRDGGRLLEEYGAIRAGDVVRTLLPTGDVDHRVGQRNEPPTQTTCMQFLTRIIRTMAEQHNMPFTDSELFHNLKHRVWAGQDQIRRQFVQTIVENSRALIPINFGECAHCTHYPAC